MCPIDQMHLRLESKKQWIERIEQESHLNDLDGGLYGMTYAKLLPKVNQYDWEDEGSSGIVVTTARNIVRDHARKRQKGRKLKQVDAGILEYLPSAAHTRPDRECELKELREAVFKALARLPQSQRALIRRRYWDARHDKQTLTGAERSELHQTRQQLRNDSRIKAFMNWVK